MDSTDESIDILSFDGGGSRGIMEVSLLNDVMRMATIVVKHPETVQSYLCDTETNILEDLEVRKRLIEDLENVSDPLHLTEVYEMIAGTSTGSMIAFALVGGKEDKDSKRIPMSVKECIEMYLEKIKIIFKKTWWHWFLSFVPGFSGIPLTTYPKENVTKALSGVFGDSSLDDFNSEELKCVVGAVARKIGSNEELVLFDTRNEDYKFYKIHQILLASVNAPIYFDTPVRIGNDEFIDGGVRGNCPLVQAMSRAKDIFGSGSKDAEITSALSIAPPAPTKSEIPRRFQLKCYARYFINLTTDGSAVYKDVVKRSKNEKTLFRRLSPRGEALEGFSTDEVNTQKMLDAIENEKLNNEMFLIDVISTAMVVVYTFVKKEKTNEVATLRVAAQLAQTTGYVYANNKEYESAIASFQTSISLWKKATNQDSNDLTILMIHHEIANCFKKQGKYHRAIKIYSSNLQYLNAHQNESNRKYIVDSHQQLADCLLLSFRYKEAEKRYCDVLTQVEDTSLRSRILTDLAWCVQKQGRLDEAVRHYFDAKMLTEGDSQNRAETLNNLGLCFLDLKMKEKAQTLIEDALDMRKRISTNDNDPNVFESLNNLGVCLMKSGDYDGAEENLNKALKMIKKNDDGDEISVAISSANLAKCLSLKNVDQNLAMAYVQQALDTMKKRIGDVENPGIAQTLAVAGLCFRFAERDDDAMKYYKMAERMTTKLFGSSHPSLEDMCRNISDLYYKKGENELLGKYYKMKVDNIAEKITHMKENIEKYLEISSNPK